jgi:LysM repeat protein
VPNEPLEPEFRDAPELAADYDLEPEPKRPRPNGTADKALPWALSAVIVLLLAVSAGLVAAWVVASLKAVPIPPSAIVTASPDPGATDQPSGAPTPAPSEQPRHTPTPSPELTPEPQPFIHVVQRGESLSLIADQYGVTVQDILALNDIRNPDNIHPGRELLIPGYGNIPSPSS